MTDASDAQPRLAHVHCVSPRGRHRMAYWEWGDPDNPKVMVCVHGLSRQGRDFDTLARDLAGEYRVICPDVVGRGQSDRLADPMGYAVPTYVADMVTLLAQLGVGRGIEQVDWVGTSMGGLIGLGVASLPGPAAAQARDGATPPPLVRRLVLNDVGPAIRPEALQRIGGYLGKPVRWATVEEAADALALISQGFGPHTREQWLALTRPQLVPVPEAEGGGWQSHYDPGIALPFAAFTREAAAIGEALLWQAWDRLTQPVLLLRGADSDLLAHETAQAMTERGPRAELVEFAGVGHAPTLVAADQRAVVRRFLLGG
jgi:pimeloyl-ACP methyl ester carboxylesterase